MHKFATLTSVWNDGGYEVTTECEVDIESGEILYVETVEHDEENMVSCDREYITYYDDEGEQTLEVCSECHDYVLQNKIVPDNVGKGLHEELLCPVCDM